MQDDGAHDLHDGYKDLLLRRRDLYGDFFRRPTCISDPRLRAEIAMLAQINNKKRGSDWVKAQGHAVVPYSAYPTLADALRANRLDRFVVKPVVGHSSKGVYLLRRRFWGGYTCAMTGRYFSGPKALVTHYGKLEADPKARVSREVILEEYVEDALGYDVPLDYKVYAFACGAPFVMQRYAPAHIGKADWGFEFYDEDGQRLGPIRLGVSSGERWGMKPPPSLPELFRMARALVVAAQVSFVRIDFYITPNGPVFGEFTPVPNNGKERFAPIYDRLLGDLWARSLKLLQLRYR